MEDCRFRRGVCATMVIAVLIAVSQVAWLSGCTNGSPSKPVADSSTPVTNSAAPSSYSGPSLAGTVLRIGFWNIREFSVKSRSFADINRIATIAKNFHALAVCEVNDEIVLGELAAQLNTLTPNAQWQAVTSPRVGNSPSASEHYGVVFRGNLLSLLWHQVLPKYETETGEPFGRDPFAVALRTVDGRLDFALVVAHITYGATVGPRIAEIRCLAKYYRHVFPREHDVLVGGDFNRNAGDELSIGWLERQTKLVNTTLPGTPTLVEGNNTYDHILLHPDYTTEYRGKHGVVKFDQEYFRGSIQEAKKVVSDHRPVWVELVVPDHDDD